MLTIESIGRRILLFGRDASGNAYVQTDDRFKPYFYYEDWRGPFRTIDGKRAMMEYCNLPSEVKIKRAQHKLTFEADIRYVNRYIIDMIDNLPKQDIRMCYLDIEIARTEKGYESAEVANNPILSICCYDSFDKTYKQWCTVSDNPSDERIMLQSFIDYIKDKNPDMLIAWNGDAFDFPFIINRIKNIGLNPNDLARGGEVYTTEYGAKIFGRILFDLMVAYKKHFSGGGRESWSLDYISKYELRDKGGKEKYRGELDDLYKNDKVKFMKYNERDVELMVMLNENLRMVEFFDEIRRMCFCRFEDVFMNSKIADCLCLKYAKGKYILPNAGGTSDDDSITGGYVRESEPKLHENVAVMDMKSLYPSVMIGFNISYETLLPGPAENCNSIDGKYFFKKETGIIPSIVKPMLELRKKVARDMEVAKNTYGVESTEYRTLWMTQYSLKVVANSFYGVLLLDKFRLYKRDAGQAITYTAQKIVKEVHKWFEDRKLKIIYGDTDSCFILMNGKSTDDMKELNREINTYFKSYFKQFGVEEQNNIFKLEFEKVYSTLFFKRKEDGTGVKKKYAGRMVWYDGKDVDIISIVGFESKRSDNPQAGREFLKKLLEMVLRRNPKPEIDSFIEQFKAKIKNNELTPEEIGLPIGIQKDLDKYGNQIHARASRIANQKHNAGIRAGDKVKYLYVKTPEGVIAFKNYLWDGYQIDTDKMINRIVDMKVGPIYNSLGWEYERIMIRKTPEFMKRAVAQNQSLMVFIK